MMQRTALNTPSALLDVAGSMHMQRTPRRHSQLRVRSCQRSDEAVNSQQAQASTAEVLERSNGGARSNSRVQIIAEVGATSAPEPQALAASPANIALVIASAGLVGLTLKALFDRGSRSKPSPPPPPPIPPHTHTQGITYLILLRASHPGISSSMSPLFNPQEV